MIRNLTPHVINLSASAAAFAAGEFTTFEPDPQGPARVSSTTEVVEPVDGFPRVRTVFGEVENLPDAAPGVFLLVSAIVRGQCPGRDDVISPDTGMTAIRGATNNVVAVIRFT
jgi:hypothetical protein